MQCILLNKKTSNLDDINVGDVYLWEKQSITLSEELKEETLSIEDSTAPTVTIYYSDSIIINNGITTLVNPTAIDSTDGGSLWDGGVYYYTSEDSSTIKYLKSVYEGTSIVVFSYYEVAGVSVEYLTTLKEDAYSNTSDGFNYVLKGKIEELISNAYSPDNKPSATDVGALGFKRILTADDDLNNIVELGIYVYYTESIPSNCPYTNAGILEVIATNSNTGRLIQRVSRYDVSGQSSMRALDAGEWKEWVDTFTGAGITMDLLWENASPTSHMFSQTIELDLTAYIAILFIYNTYRSSNDCVGSNSQIVLKDGITRRISDVYQSSNANNSYYAGRDITVENSGVTVGNGIIGAGSQVTSTIYTVYPIIPNAIYGIKGMLNAEIKGVS